MTDSYKYFERKQDFLILSFDEWNDFNKAIHELWKNKSCCLNKRSLVKKFQALADWLDDYTEKTLRIKELQKTIKPDQIIGELHLDDPYFFENSKQQQLKKYFDAYLYCCMLYLNFLKEQVKSKIVTRYFDTFFTMQTCVELAVVMTESFRNSALQKENILLCHRTNNTISPFNILTTANQIFNLEVLDAKDIDRRNVKPSTVFFIRQLLEKIGSNLIGYEKIEDKNRKVIPKFTQVAWDFLGRNKKSPDFSVTLPIPIDTVLKVNRWSNRYVHTAKIYEPHIVFYVLYHVIHPLMRNKGDVKDYTGKLKINVNYGDFKIEHYNKLKSHFEDFVNKGFIPGSYPNIVWLPLDQVGGYIMSLD